MNARRIAGLVSFLIVIGFSGVSQAQIVLESTVRSSMARVLMNNCTDEWETQIQLSDSIGPIEHEVLAGLSGIAFTSQYSNLQITDSTIAASGFAATSSEYEGICLPPLEWERNFCLAEYQIIFRVMSDASYEYSCNLSHAGGGNKFLLNEFPGGPILANEYGNVASFGSGSLPAGKTYQLYVNAGVNLCWGCEHCNIATFDFEFTVVLDESPVIVENCTWSAIKALYR